MNRPMHIAACSGGKDSVATILLSAQHGDPLDEVVFSEVMFDPVSYTHLANRYYGFTAQQTLDLVQTLYEKKLLSYPARSTTIRGGLL